MKHFIARTVILAALSLMAIGCGSQQTQILSNLAVQTSTVDSDIIVDVKADLSLGSISLPAVAFPILHPRGQTPIGMVEFIPVIGAKNQIRINLNLSEVVDLHTAPSQLPNGTSIPLIASNHVAVINLGNGGKVYILLTQQASAVGFAMPLSSLDRLGQQTPGINIFPVANFNGIMATAGMFLSASPGKSGIALVADLSSVFKLPDGSKSAAPALMAMQAEEDNIRLDFSPQEASAAAKKKIDSVLFDMNKKRAKLKL